MVEFVIGTGGGADTTPRASRSLTRSSRSWPPTPRSSHLGLFGAAGFHLKSDRYTYSLPAGQGQRRVHRQRWPHLPSRYPGEPAGRAGRARHHAAAHDVGRAAGHLGSHEHQHPDPDGQGRASRRARRPRPAEMAPSPTRSPPRGTTGCTVDVSKGIVKYTDVGECEVTARPRPGPRSSSSGSQAVVFTISSTAVQAKPDISGVEPATGPRAGGNTITIAGHNFTGATKVTIGGKSAKFEAMNKNSHISALAPAAKQDGRVTIVVSIGGPRGAATAPDIYAYEAVPATTAAAPAEATVVAPTPAIDDIPRQPRGGTHAPAGSEAAVADQTQRTSSRRW